MMVGRGAVLAFMRSYYEDFGVPPSFRQICAKLGFRSPKAASYHIEKLVLEGSVRRLDGEGRHRGYVPTGYKVVKA
jgi:SOS-response transcriptional repressor LexA